MEESIAESISPLIRQATLVDADALARLRWDFSPDEAALGAQTLASFMVQFRVWLAEALAGRTWTIWVAEIDGRIVANIYIHHTSMVPRPGRFHRAYGYVSNVYTVPELRGRGIGALLLTHVAAWAREERLEFLLLWPSETSGRFYERAGFMPSADALELELE